MNPKPEPSESLDARIRAAEARVEPAKEPGPDNGSGIGFEFGGAILVCALAGAGLDRWLGTNPWGLIGGAAVGFAAGMAGVWRGLKDPKNREQ